MDTSLLLPGDEMGHLVNGNNFHSSALSEAIIIGLFSLFSFLGKGKVPNCLILYVLTSSDSQIPFDDNVLCEETFISQRLLSF